MPITPTSGALEIGARGMLRRMRDIMASRASAQARLDQLTVAIASSLVADICSIYLRRPTGALELCATFGLSQSAVHKTRLPNGHGIVGHVLANAKPLNLQRAGDHPSFEYREETGENPDASFLAVPILRGGRPIGVLTIQTNSAKNYNDDDTEALQTAAMVLGEVVTDTTIGEGAFAGLDVRPHRPDRVDGRRVSDGIVIGEALRIDPHVMPSRILADNPLVEVKRLERGLALLHERIEDVLSARAARLGDQPREVLEAYSMIARDPVWINRLTEAARSGLTAEAAVDRVRQEYRARFLRSTNAYLRERLHDLEDLANRLLRHLDEAEGRHEERHRPENAVLFVRSIGPAEMLDQAHRGLVGLVMEEGGTSTHAAIVAKAMGIVMIARAEGVLDRVENGDTVVVDGVRGEVHLRPPSDVVENYRHRIASRGQLRSEYERIKDNPAITLDGHRIELMLNAGLLVDLPQIARTGADGIGLFRTEFQFLVAEQMPRIRQQIALYESALIEAGDKPVTFRTLDLGGDKILNFARAEREENPALGWRGARMAIDRPRLARYQLRGLIRAAAGRSLRLMFPGITTTEEFLFLRGLLDMEIARAERRNHLLPQSVKVGAMIETPAIAFDASALLAHADFISVGANDLAQHFFAADRDNARVNERYDPLHPAFLRLLQSLVTAARTAQKPIAICGEIAGQPLAALALIGLGYRTLSMAAPQIGPVKQAILGLNTAQLSAELNAWMQTSSESLREPLRTFAELHAIRLGGEG